MNQSAEMIYRRVDGVDYSAARDNTALFSLLLVIDGTRSVKTIAQEDKYEIEDLLPLVDQVEKLGLIVPVESDSGRAYQEAPEEVSFCKLPKEYQTGIVMVDNQHQRLVDMVKQLDAIRKGQYPSTELKNKAIGQVVVEMIDYTVSHFAFEESLMQEANYEHYNGHKRTHDHFISLADEYKQRFVSGEDIIDELYKILNRWLYNHIQNDDMAFAPVVLKTVKAKGLSKGAWMKRLLNKFFN